MWGHGKRTLTCRHAVHAIEVRLEGAFPLPCARVLTLIVIRVALGAPDQRLGLLCSWRVIVEERGMRISKRRWWAGLGTGDDDDDGDGKHVSLHFLHRL